MFKTILNSRHSSLLKFSLLQLFLLYFLTGISYAETNRVHSGLKSLVTLKAKNADLKTILKDIEKQAQISFSYQKDVLTSEEKINAEFSNETVENALEKLLTPRNISYQVLKSNHLILTKKVSHTDTQGAVENQPK